MSPALASVARTRDTWPLSPPTSSAIRTTPSPSCSTASAEPRASSAEAARDTPLASSATVGVLPLTLCRQITTWVADLTAFSSSVSPVTARYSALSLLSRGLRGRNWPRVWRRHDLAETYDAVIIGAGVHGLAAAYYLAANHGMHNV